ncbi:hypothetical protein C5167_005574 [Papaver somniferum]|uniref:H15 domain-containing protein n=1 Tax=Papaver somniferum TaxID=3469 RepID=A0A4Y7JF36_PAPSO|nr:HMG-Y-related protein A-like [Papaver somniferum]RZC58255.1 hypothetical protein C5167_005574 [Papaver somniferum]
MAMVPRSLPQYPEMIFRAISALNEAAGSNKSSISNYIESTYGDLPAGHTELLTQNLDKLKESGELVFVKNNYMRPNPDAPAKRGRGRPPKPKSAAAMALAAAKAAHVGPPRGRGRPPKNKDESGGASVAEKRKVSEPSGRPRGRPKKVKADEGEGEGGDDEEGDDDEVVPAGVPGGGGAGGLNITGSPKPRGRPPKVKAPFGTVGF